MSKAFEAMGWDDELGWWSGAAEVAPGHRIDLHVECANDPASLSDAVVRVRPAWERLRSGEPAVRAEVAGQMAGPHNEFCDPADEVTEAQFAVRLSLLSAKFESAGTVELVYADGMLLGGHWIIVPVAADGSVGEAFEAG